MLLFGNPSRNFLKNLNTESYLDSLLPELASYAYPDNNSQEAIDEINKLVAYTNELESNIDLQKRFDIYDANFENYIISVLSNVGIPADEVTSIMKDIHDDIIPIILKLKYHFQRIRPNQLSIMLSMKMYPFASATAYSPSYPSGHSLQSRLYCEVLGNKYPKYYKQLNILAEDISQSRLYMGVHYPSDCEFSQYIATLVLNNPEFKKKYKL
jgi:hypothetical protein